MSVAWNHGQQADLVSIGTHSLYVSVAGPERLQRLSGSNHALQPLVIVIPGLGSTSAEWVVVQRLISSFARIMIYDRSGLGKSDIRAPTVDDETASLAAEELLRLLKETSMEGPYLLVAHSYGGIIAREFLHINPELIAGMVMVDTTSENSDKELGFPESEIGALLEGLNYLSVVGITSESAQMTASEFQDFMDYASSEKTGATGAREAACFASNSDKLASKRQLETHPLGAKPLSIIRAGIPQDLRKILEAGIEKENGTEELRDSVRKALIGMNERDDKLKAEQMDLSANSEKVRYVVFENETHNLHGTRPDVIVEEVKWALERTLDSARQLRGTR